MHLGRFHTAVAQLATYFRELETDAHLSEAVSLMQAYSTSKSTDQLKAFREKLHSIASRVEKVPSSFLLPSVISVHRDLSIEEYVGAVFAKKIRNAMKAPGLLPEEVVLELVQLKTGLAEVVGDIEGLSARLENRAVEYVSLEPEAGEFGIALPTSLVGDEVKDLISEVTHLNRLFLAFNELLGRGSESPKVRTIASSDWQFFLQLDSTQFMLWSVALERIVNLIKSGYEIRKLKQDLEKQPELVPEGVVQMFEEKMLSVFKKGVADLAADLRQKCNYDGDQNRANELEVQLKQELLHLVRRVNAGAVMEVRVGIPIAPVNLPADVEGEDANGALRLEAQARIDQLVQLNEKLADLSGVTAQIELREDLLLEVRTDEAQESSDEQ